MRGERHLLRLGEYLVRRACQQLPQDTREERHREWTAELPAILHDPQVRFAPRRAARMLGYAADTLRGAALTPSTAQRRADRLSAAFYLLLLAGGLVSVALSIQAIIRATGHGPNYVQLAWSLILVAWPTSKLCGTAERTTALIAMSSNLAAAAFFLWNAALAPGDWVNYFVAALALLAFWLVSPWARNGRHAARRAAS